MEDTMTPNVQAIPHGVMEGEGACRRRNSGAATLGKSSSFHRARHWGSTDNRRRLRIVAREELADPYADRNQRSAATGRFNSPDFRVPRGPSIKRLQHAIWRPGR